MQYRRDIDGLRAVAVVPVVLFHSGLGLFSGGFVGVDIFFVISGYLITCILTQDFEKRRYSILNFYERRVRRILPALVAIILASIVAAVALCTPHDLMDFAASIAATMGFVSNVLFFDQSGYFATAAHYKPLLHTWSLAVEEQFYILYPPLLWLGLRYARRMLPVILFGCAVVSLAAAQYGLRHHPDAVFFLAPFRAWELLIGCLLAIGAVPELKSRGAAESIAAAGLVAIGYSILAYTSDTRFPGIAALPPTVGAAALIYANARHRTFVGRLLSSRPFVTIGLMSYSLYLWHWPIFAFCRIALLRAPTPIEALAMIGLAVVLAAFSLRFIEQPFRNRATLGRAPLFASAALACALLLAIGGVGYATGGLPDRFSPDVTRMAAFTHSPAVLDWLRTRHLDGCVLRGEMDDKAVRRCIGGNSPDTVLVAGDSLAEHVFPGFAAVVARQGLKARLVAMVGCAPATGGRQTDDCAAFDDALWASLRRQHFAAIVLVGHWYYAGNGNSGNVAVDDALISRLSAELKHLPSGQRVVVVGPTPEFDEPVPNILARDIANHVSASDVQMHLLMGPRALDALMKRHFTKLRSVQYVSAFDALCAKSTCPVLTAGVPVYQDALHWTLAGSAFEAPRLMTTAAWTTSY